MPKAKLPSLVGVIHLPPLPDAPQCSHPAARAVMDAVKLAVREAVMLEKAGFEAIIIENFGDVPFYRASVPPMTVAAMSVVASQVRHSVRLPLGINVLRNDAESALAIAAATGCQFIRVNVLSGVAATDQGIIQGQAASLVRKRTALAREGTFISIWGDVLVKHARTLSTDVLEPALEEAAWRAGADAVILTGATTGRAADPSLFKRAAQMKLGHPIYAGSGTTAENLEVFAPWIDGVIVGSALRRGGKAGATLEQRRATQYAKAFFRVKS